MFDDTRKRSREGRTVTRILMISDVYFPRVNGVSTSVATYTESLRNLGHEVTLIAPRYPAGQGAEPGIFRVDSRGLPIDHEDRMMQFKAAVGLEHAARAWAPDVIHIQTPFVAHYAGLRLAERLARPTVESYHTYFEEYLQYYIPLVPRPALKLLARRLSARQGNSVDALIVPSRAMHDRLVRYGVSTRLEVIPTGLNPDRFRQGDRQRFRRWAGIDNHRPVLLYVGRVAHEKNIDFLLHIVARVCKSLPSVALVIAGEGPAERHLKRMTARLGITDNVIFVGYLDRERSLPDCYAAADVFVFSSRTETQGLVLLEAMAMGVPVVALAEMGTRDVLQEGKGVLIADDNRDDFARKVHYLLLHKEARRDLGRRAREYAGSWSNLACTHRLVTVYDQLLDAQRRRASVDSAPALERGRG